MNEKDDEGHDGDTQGDGQSGDGPAEIGDGGFQILHTGNQMAAGLIRRGERKDFLQCYILNTAPIGNCRWAVLSIA